MSRITKMFGRSASLNSWLQIRALIVIGAIPVLSLALVWGWHASVDPVEGLENAQATSTDGALLAPADDTNAISILPSNPKEPSSSIAFISMDVGVNHACGVLSSGRVVCWGRNSWGQATPTGRVIQGSHCGKVPLLRNTFR